MATQAALRQHFLPLVIEDIIAYRSFDSSEDLVLTLLVQEKINGGDAYKIIVFYSKAYKRHRLSHCTS
jgi:hypothetical protein